MFTWPVITDHKRGRRGQPLFLILTLKGARSRLCIEGCWAPQLSNNSGAPRPLAMGEAP
jgi:hypothetical protein